MVLKDLGLEIKMDTSALKREIDGLSLEQARHLMDDLENGTAVVIIEHERSEDNSLILSARLASGYVD
jgi:hypothetical protein